MKIHLLGYYKKNLGDDLLVAEFLKLIKKENDISVDIMKGPYLDDKVYNDVNKISLFKILFKKYDRVVFIGGSTIPNKITFKAKLLNFIFNNYYKYMKMKGAKIIYLNLNLYERTNEYEKILEQYEKNVDLFLVRDNLSYEQLNCKQKEIIFDLADYPKEKIDTDKKILGFNIVEYSSEKKILEILEYIISISDQYEEIRFVEFQNSKEINGKKIKEIIEKKNLDIRYIEYNKVNESLKKIAECDKFVADRFHAMILANNYGILDRVYSYDEKIKNYISSRGYEIEIYNGETKIEVKAIEKNKKILIKDEIIKKIRN